MSGVQNIPNQKFGIGETCIKTLEFLWMRFFLSRGFSLRQNLSTIYNKSVSKTSLCNCWCVIYFGTHCDPLAQLPLYPSYKLNSPSVNIVSLFGWQSSHLTCCNRFTNAALTFLAITLNTLSCTHLTRLVPIWRGEWEGSDAFSGRVMSYKDEDYTTLVIDWQITGTQNNLKPGVSTS